MDKILVCINDGLLKIRIKRILSENDIPHIFTSNPIKSSDLFRYAIIIIHSSYKLANLFKFVEKALVNGDVTIIFISSNPASSQFLKFRDYPNLILVDENKMDTELKTSINIYNKLYSDIHELRKQKILLEKELNLQKLLNRCKRILMETGLTEEAAHKLILKYAMDNKITKEEACKRLISEKTK